MLGNSSGGAPLSNRTMIGVRGLARVAPKSPGRVSKKRGVEEQKLDRVDRDEGRSALFDYDALAEDEAERHIVTQPAGHATARRTVTDDAFRTDERGRDVPPVFSDVDQGNLGDAWLLAAFASVAEMEPRSILERFRRCDQTTWAVTVADETLIVTAEFPSEGYADVRPNGQDNTLWVALLEKAFAQREAGSYSNLEHGHPGRALEALTDRRSTKMTVTASTEGLYVALRSAREERRAVVLHTCDAGVKTPLHPDHCYALLDVFERDGVEIAKIYNPWGTNGGEKALSSLVHELRVDTLQNDIDAIWMVASRR